MKKGLDLLSSVKSSLISDSVIQRRVQAIGQQISLEYRDEGEEYPLVVICILKGAFVFCADLIRTMHLPLEVHFMAVSSYGDTTSSSGVVKIEKDIDIDIAGRNVLIVEDIVDTGLTLAYLKEFLSDRKPRSLSICTLLDKPAAREKEVKVDYVGFEIGDDFVVGYGLDYAQQLRNLSGIGILKPEIYQEDEE
ncbi:hypoxanthine phosphoribosyltransferase [Candidatus Parcubacteria bacterium]|mgnify:CR=1 FL=1|jgi:hypoxanthine phosphoribosyltransferase|nr:hypoxanthine phosphoribosyltransferase [Candidatus Parcubacteria bacterium]